VPAAQIVASRYPARGTGLTYEPSERWVRAVIGEVTVVDSKRPLLVWEPGRPVATYAFPVEDVRSDLLRSVPGSGDQERAGAVEWYDLELDGRRFERLAWRYGEGPLNGHIGVDWFARKTPGVEHWYEEEEEVFVHPRDPHKRVDPLPSSRHVQIAVDGRPLADTHRPVLLYETWLPVRYYVPREDVDFALLEESDLLTRCPYKGIARYWSVPAAVVGTNIVWSYEDPIAAAAAITGHLSFYNEVVDITVDGVVLERPVTHFNDRIANNAPDTTGVPV
jgi:uncharacterized protein (DUF427 family)